MKRIVIALVLAVGPIASFACEVCKKRQPKPLRGITHGAGPDSNWDYLIIALVAAIVVVSLVYSVKWLIRPGERDAAHIKNSILTPERL